MRLASLEESVSPYDAYCDGFASPSASGRGYYVAFVLGTGRARASLGHPGSDVLDRINAFDKAELEHAYIGQINMITVSSFCGLAGAVWGYDVVRPAGGLKAHALIPEGVVRRGRRVIPVRSASPLLTASQALFGTVASKRFPLLPGAHVPCAVRHMEMAGPCHVYAAFGMGIARDRGRDANLIMEDVGIIPLSVSQPGDATSYRAMILDRLAQSVLAVGENQGVEYAEILLELKDTRVAPGDMGSALIAAPYFTLARQALPAGGADRLRTLTLDEWEHDRWPDSSAWQWNRTPYRDERPERLVETAAR